jgi:hypothetical protein
MVIAGMASKINTLACSTLLESPFTSTWLISVMMVLMNFFMVNILIVIYAYVTMPVLKGLMKGRL